MRGTITSVVNFVRADRNGFWLDVASERLFVAFADFPWFEGATIEQLRDVHQSRAGHLHWPALDVDLALDSIRHPEAFPLIAKTGR